MVLANAEAVAVAAAAGELVDPVVPLRVWVMFAMALVAAGA